MRACKLPSGSIVLTFKNKKEKEGDNATGSACPFGPSGFSAFVFSVPSVTLWLALLRRTSWTRWAA